MLQRQSTTTQQVGAREGTCIAVQNERRDKASLEACEIGVCCAWRSSEYAMRA